MAAPEKVTPERVKRLLSSFLVPESSCFDTERNFSVPEIKECGKESVNGSSGQNQTSKVNEDQISVQMVPSPRSRDAYFKRVDTFTTFNWFAKPVELSPLVCARYGWQVIELDMLECVGCKAKLSGRLPKTRDLQIYPDCCKKLKYGLTWSHKKSCSWLSNPSPESFAVVPLYNIKEIMQNFYTRLKAIQACSSHLPVISRRSVVKQGLDEDTIDEIVEYFLREFDQLSTGNTKAALLLTICGWNLSDHTGRAVLECNYCQRTIGLWNYRPSSQTDHKSSPTTDDQISSPTDDQISTRIDDPTSTPTDDQTSTPTDDPTSTPIDDPTSTPIDDPTSTPTDDQISSPTDDQTSTPTDDQTSTPTDDQTSTPTDDQISSPTDDQTSTPTDDQISTPSDDQISTPTNDQTSTPTDDPPSTPTDDQTSTPTDDQTSTPTDNQASAPTDNQTSTPTDDRTSTPTDDQASAPTDDQTSTPTDDQTSTPTDDQTSTPTDDQTSTPTDDQTSTPTDDQTSTPTDDQTSAPTDDQTSAPTDDQTSAPTDDQSSAPPDDQASAPTNHDHQTSTPTRRRYEDKSDDGPVKKKFKVTEKESFDPLAEHRYWCSWLVDPTSPKEQTSPTKGYLGNQYSSPTFSPVTPTNRSFNSSFGEMTPGAHHIELCNRPWFSLLRLVCPAKVLDTEPTMTDHFKQNSPTAGLRQLRKLMRTWSSHRSKLNSAS